MLGEKLLALRKKHGFSQQELADRLSVSRQTISNWECGNGAPSLDKAAELAALYQISLDDLTGNRVGIIVGRKRPSNRLLRSLVGRKVKMSSRDGDLAVNLGFDWGFNAVVKILEVQEEWLRIEYTRTREDSLTKKETVVSLLEIDLLSGFELMEDAP